MVNLIGRSHLKTLGVALAAACLAALLVFAWWWGPASPRHVRAPRAPGLLACDWGKEVWINGELAGGPGDGPFTVVYSDTVTVADDLWCDATYDWSLWESWQPTVLALQEGSISLSDGSWDGDVTTGWLEWYTDEYVPAETWVHMEKSFTVLQAEWLTTTLSEFVDFGPLQWDEPIVFERGGQCLWDKELWINGEFAGEPEDGPFGVVYSDTVTVADDLWCHAAYDWSLWEEWQPAVLELQEGSISISDGSWDGDGATGWLEWYSDDYVSAATWVHMEKTFYVVGEEWDTTVISEFVDFGPLLWDEPVVFREGAEYDIYLPMVARGL